MSLKRNVTVPTGRLAIGSIVYNDVNKAGKPLVPPLNHSGDCERIASAAGRGEWPMRGFAAIAAVAAGLVVASGSAAASAPSLQFSRNVVNAGKIHLTEAADFDVILTNVGSESLTLTTAEITPNPNTFISPSGCAIGSTLGVGQSCLFEINIAGNEVGQIKGEFCWTAVGATITDRKCGRVTGKVIPS